MNYMSGVITADCSIFVLPGWAGVRSPSWWQKNDFCE